MSRRPQNPVRHAGGRALQIAIPAAGPDESATRAAMRDPAATRGIRGGCADPRSFDHLAAHQARLVDLVGAETRAWLFLRLPVRAGRAVDLGCGTGAYCALLAERFTEVLAVDVSGPMLRQARARRPGGNVRFEQRDLRQVTAGLDGRFDTVISTLVLHHLPDLAETLDHLRSLVRPGGQLLVTDSVDGRGRVARSSLRAEAWRTFRADVLLRRRPIEDATELLRLQLAPDWLEHRSTDRLHPPKEWTRIVRRVLPDAAIGQIEGSRAAHWKAPAWI